VIKNKEILKIISNETIDALDTMSIITPSIYTTIFEKKAKSHHLDMDEQEEREISKDLILHECSELVEMRENNSKSVIKLSASTSKAIEAIKKKDEHSLNEVLKEAEKLRREIEALKDAVYKDELTGVFNRKWLKDHYLKSHNNKFALNGTMAIVDLNFFKEVNDKHGHAVGDKVLIFIANNLKKTKADVIRYGGDEFLIMFDDKVDAKDVFSKINKIYETVLHKKLKAKNGEFKVSFSVGISKFKQDDYFSVVLEDADKKMYENKKEIKKLL
jgi:diguanylate cyclase (GGDEF)-like protein